MVTASVRAWMTTGPGITTQKLAIISQEIVIRETEIHSKIGTRLRENEIVIQGIVMVPDGHRLVDPRREGLHRAQGGTARRAKPGTPGEAPQPPDAAAVVTAWVGVPLEAAVRVAWTGGGASRRRRRSATT